VTGTDVSARALDFVRFSGALNGVRIDTRQGDLFEPVAGERFDQVVSNLWRAPTTRLCSRRT
jgi:methylase of polypeptide subunit release factors